MNSGCPQSHIGQNAMASRMPRPQSPSEKRLEPIVSLAMFSLNSVPIRRSLCVILLGPALPVALAGADLTLQVSNETAPAGGWVQVKISLAAPALIAKGRIVMDFYSSVFGDIGAVAVFSAAGDAYGFATATSQNLDVQFSSPSGSVGQLRNLPIVVATIPVRPSAKPGTVVPITAVPQLAILRDPLGSTYSVTVMPGSLTVGGSLSVQNVAPGGGIVPAGGILQIKGSGLRRKPQSRSTVSVFPRLLSRGLRRSTSLWADRRK